MREILFRCSSIGKLMTDAQSVGDEFRTPEVQAVINKTKRTEEEKKLIATLKEKTLSDTAKSYIRSLVAQEIFTDFEISSKEMEKGRLVEPDGITLLNRVRDLSLVKNSERRSNEWIIGECDLYDAERRRGHDIKCPWSIATFPILPADCEDKLYEWQMRGYMMLWDADEWEVNYTLVSTPEELVRYEPQTMHFVDHYPEHLRLTTWTVRRDPAKEEAMIEKIKAAREYYAQVLTEFEQTHRKA